MKKLILMRGCPGSGKSTWIKKYNLELYTLCPDELRILFSSLEKQADGSYRISQKHDKVVWETFDKMLEYRMSIGVPTVVDATCSLTKDLRRYKELADKYKYEVVIIDFTKVPLETCLVQNKTRPEWKFVPEEAIRNIYSRYATQQIPDGIELIDKDDEESIAKLINCCEVLNEG